MKTITIAESDAAMRAELQQMLMAEHYTVQVAVDGENAVNSLKQSPPDLLIMNVQLSRKNGFQVLKEIREELYLVNLPVVLISSYKDRSLKTKALQSGALAYHEWPEDKIYLIPRVEGVLNWIEMCRIAMPFDGQKKGRKKEERFVLSVNSCIEQKLSDPDLSMAELANDLGVSTSTLQKNLKKFASKSVSQYIREYRLHRAKDLITAGNSNLAEVASSTGFRNQSYFSKSFRMCFGYSPSAV